MTSKILLINQDLESRNARTVKKMEKKMNVIAMGWLLFGGLLVCIGIQGANDQLHSEFNRTTAGLSTTHVPVSIDGDAALDAFLDKEGDGTKEIPYLIENLEIDAGAVATASPSRTRRDGSSSGTARFQGRRGARDPGSSWMIAFMSGLLTVLSATTPVAFM